MLKQSLGPGDHTGMLSDQLRSDLSSSALLHRRAQIHRKLQFALCYSDASCIVVCVKVAPQHLIVGWQVPPFHTVTLLSHFKDLQIFIETIIYIYNIYVKSLLDPSAIQHMAMHVMFRRDLNELKVSRKAERPNVRPRVGLSAFALVADSCPGPADETCRMIGTLNGSMEKMKTQERR